MTGLKEFLETSSIHGLVYLATTEKVTRLVWMFVVMAGFAGAAVLIQQSLSSWEANPVSTTLKIRPIEEIPFPRVTVCPPENTFTTLNLDMETMETKTLDQLTKKALNDTLPSVIFDSDFEEKLSFFSKATNVSRGWYLGDTQISFLSEEDDYVRVKLRSSALSGTVSTPFFNEEFNQQTFKRNITFRIEIDKPNISHDNTTIDIKIDFDTDKQIIGRDWEIVKLVNGQKDWWNPFSGEEILMEITNATSFTTKYFVNEYNSYFCVEFRRNMSVEDVYRWKHKRNTGLRLSWSYSDKELVQEYKYRQQNEHFINLVNNLHKLRNKDIIEEAIKKNRNVYLENLKMGETCIDNVIKSNDEIYKLEGISEDTTNYGNEISDETLLEAQKMFYYLARCPNVYDKAFDLKNQFSRLITSSSSVKTVVVTLARLMNTSISNGNGNELRRVFKEKKNIIF